jgi:hypothetical protein
MPIKGLLLSGHWTQPGAGIVPVVLYPLLKFVIVVLIVLPLSFLVALVIRKLPLASKIL